MKLTQEQLLDGATILPVAISARPAMSAIGGSGSLSSDGKRVTDNRCAVIRRSREKSDAVFFTVPMAVQRARAIGAVAATREGMMLRSGSLPLSLAVRRRCAGRQLPQGGTCSLAKISSAKRRHAFLRI